jgi:hypothetical protein
MRVLQCTKRSVALMAAVCVVLAGCGDSGPEVPFNASGTSEDIAALNGTFDTPVFASFSIFSQQFDAAMGGAPLVTTAARAFNFRRATSGGELRAAALRNARAVAAMIPSAAQGNYSVSSAAIPPDLSGKTFEYVNGAYVATDRAGAPSNGVRFIIYAVNPITSLPTEPLDEVGYAQLTDESGTTNQAARVVVVSGETTYLDYTVAATATASGGRVSVTGFVTDGDIRANVNLRSTVSQAVGLTLLYTLDVPKRDVSIDLSLTMTGLDQETGTIDIDLGMAGPNGSVSMAGQFSETGGTLTVRVNGKVFATLVSTGAGEPVITGADGEPITEEDVQALRNLFEMTGSAFTSFDLMIAPFGSFLSTSA